MIEIWQKQYSKLCKRSFNSLYSILFLSILFHRTIFSRFLHGFIFNIWNIIYHWKALIPLFLMGWLSKCHFCILHHQAFFTLLTFYLNILAIQLISGGGLNWIYTSNILYAIRRLFGVYFRWDFYWGNMSIDLVSISFLLFNLSIQIYILAIFYSTGIV